VVVQEKSAHNNHSEFKNIIGNLLHMDFFVLMSKCLKITLFHSIKIDLSTKMKRDHTWSCILRGHVAITRVYHSRKKSTDEGAREGLPCAPRHLKPNAPWKRHWSRRRSIISKCCKQKVQEPSVAKPCRSLLSPV
jgi:hypothetical protein